jgi:hypothetical protein
MKHINWRRSPSKTSKEPRKKTMKRFIRRYDAADRELKLKAQADQRQAERLSASATASENSTKAGNVATAEVATAPTRPTLDEMWGLA